MKRVLAFFVVLTMLFGTALAAEITPQPTITPVPSPTPMPEPMPSFVEARIITHVLDEGQAVSGVRLEWDREFRAGALTVDSFTINGYTILGVYVNNDGVLYHAESAGKYVFLILEDPVGIGTQSHGTIQYKEGHNILRDVTLDIFSHKDANMYTARTYIHDEVDDYLTGEETNDGATTPYRLFVPDGWQKTQLPLVIWLHGAGERGTNNFTQIAANRGALNYSDLEAQAEHPCFVLAPQANDDGWDEKALKNIHALVIKLMSEYNIDGSRIYVTGCSMGGMGSKALIYAYPEMIAATVVIANSNFTYDEDQIRNLTTIPAWLITGENDFPVRNPDAPDAITDIKGNLAFMEGLGVRPVTFIENDGLNGFLRGQAAVMDIQRVIDKAQQENNHLIVTTYKVGTIEPSPHWSWMAATDNRALRNWMFSFTKEPAFTGQ